MNKKLIAPIVSIAALAAVSIGTTYALFTDKKSADVIINAGKVKVDMESSINFALSRYEDEPPFDAVANAIALGSEHDAVYENGNTADLSSDVTTSSIAVTLDRMTPMDNISISVKVTNQSNVKIKWRVGVETEGELIPALDVEFNEEDYSTTAITKTTKYSNWSTAVDPSDDPLIDSDLYIAFPDHGDDDNQYQEKQGTVRIFVEAIQGNAEVDDCFVATTKEDLMSYVAGWNSGTEHRSLRLGANIDVSDEVWTPLGTWQYPFFGEVKGKNFTINGLGKGGLNPVFTETGEYVAGFIGIAGSTEAGESLTVSNLSLTNAEIDLPDTGANIGILMGYAPITSDFNSKGEKVGEGNQELSSIIVKKVSVDGEVSGKKTCGGLIGKSYISGTIEIANCNIDADVATASNHIAEIIAYVNYASALNVHNNTLSGSLSAPIDQYRMDDEIVIATFLETYLIDSNVSDVKFYYDDTEIDDPLKITNEFEEDGSLKSINVVWDGKDLGKNVITAAHGSNKLRITLKNSAANNNQQIMTNQASDDVIVTLDNFSTTGNISIANLILKGDCNISNSYTTAKKTLSVEDGNYKNVTVDSNCVGVMTGGKVTKLSVNYLGTLSLEGGAGEEIYLSPGSSLNTGVNLVPATEDNFTFKVTIGNNRGTGRVTTVNGQEYDTQGMTLYFLVV
ncbi:MAG: SipW-dependent-type signal peptide-containing protein [Bacilli bacterium]|nr:SipW-dependent-type signal peptide-containing protein [Bacilli bacterium]